MPLQLDRLCLRRPLLDSLSSRRKPEDSRFPLVCRPGESRDPGFNIFLLENYDRISYVKARSYYVYILASGKNGTLYVGVTDDLERRVEEHKNNAVDGFTKKYHVNDLVYYEKYDFIYDAISREKHIKEWQRK